jgi:type IV pilus assembly protein PilC
MLIKYTEITKIRFSLPKRKTRIIDDEIKPKSQPFENLIKDFSFGKLSLKEQAFFAKRLSFLIHAGVPLLDAIHMIREQTKIKKQQKVFDSVIHDISNGQSLASSLGKFKNVFGDFAINMIAVGEETGVLSENLAYLANELKKRQELKRKVIGALVYPIFISIATFGLTGLLTAYIFPKILPIFASLNVDLPITTRIMIWLSDFLRHWGWLVIILAIFFVMSFILTLKRSEKFHFFFDRNVLRIPFIGNMIQNYNLANISRTLSLLLNGGMTLTEAIPITSRSTGNLVYKGEFLKLSKVVDRGEKLSSHLATERKLFPDILSQIVSVGERSGNLSETLGYLSDLYEAEVEDSTKNLSSLIEPILMIFMGLIVGFVAISVITPIYGITQHLSPR